MIISKLSLAEIWEACVNEGMLRFLVLLAVLSRGAFASEFNPGVGERIVWAGDSITHQCKYTQYVEDFLYTRFSDKRLRFYNAGIKGDSAKDLLDRFDEDVAFFEPDWATVLLGMNDGRYRGYDAANFELYQKDMTRALDRFERIGANAVILSPSMFDHRQYNLRNQEDDFRFKRTNPHSEYNAKLAFYGGWLRSVAVERGLPYLDFWGAMNDLTAQFRLEDETFSFLPDSIHPNPSGMAIMAERMATFFAGERDLASRVSIEVTETNAKAIEGDVIIEEFDGDGLLANVRPRALPWVLAATGKMGPAPWKHVDDPRLGFAAALEGSNLNDDILEVTGLYSGRYDVYMNGEWILQADHFELAHGLRLQNVENTPAYRQSIEVALLNAERNDEAMRPYRNLQGRMKGARKKNADSPEALARFREGIAPELDRLLRLAQAYEERIHEIAVPRAYRLEIRRVQ